MNISVTCRIEFQLYSSYFGFGLTTLDKTGWKQLPLEQMEHWGTQRQFLENIC